VTSAASWKAWVIPPAISSWAGRQLSRNSPLDDSVGSWAHAVQQSSGYNQQLIAEKVFQSTTAVLRGDAAFERDSVTFPTPEYRWPVIAGLLSVAAREGDLRVLDFGGSLGSTYWQHRDLLEGVQVSWAVVEQENFVSAAKDLEQHDIKFFNSIDSAVRDTSPNAILISSVLQYLPDPDLILQELLNTPANTLIIDRTPMADIQENVACIQVVPPSIYPASYPAWIVSRSWLTRELHAWEIIAEFDGIEPRGVTAGGIAFGWDGLIARRKSHD
jgi:putative methyltransferase (TIGR04325 family)